MRVTTAGVIRWAWMAPLMLVAGCLDAPVPETPASDSAMSTVATIEAPVLPVTHEIPPTLAGRIAFHSDRQGRNKIFEVTLPAGGVRPLTSGSDHHDEGPAWDTAGSRLAFTTTRFDSDTYSLALLDERDGTVSWLARPSAFDTHARWAPDGQWLYFSSERDGRQAVHALHVSTGQVERISRVPERALMPAVSPDGQRLAYVAATDDGFHVVEQTLSTGAVRVLTTGPVEAIAPAWSPDGTRLLYTRTGLEGSHLEVLDVESGESAAVVIAGYRWVGHGTWAPDGLWIAIDGTATRGLTEDWDLLAVPGDLRGTVVTLTRGRGHDRAPAWRR